MATELRQHLENRPVVTWLVKEHENATNFTTERYNLINKIMGWNNDAGSGRQSHSGDTFSVLYESSIYDEQCASDTGGSCVSTSSRSVWSAEAKRGTSRPPSETDSERTEFRFDPDRVTDVDPDDPWLQSFQQKKTAQESEDKQPTPGPNDSFQQALKLIYYRFIKRFIEARDRRKQFRSTVPVASRYLARKCQARAQWDSGTSLSLLVVCSFNQLDGKNYGGVDGHWSNGPVGIIVLRNRQFNHGQFFHQNAISQSRSYRRGHLKKKISV
jgi:hypothetical protein